MRLSVIVPSYRGDRWVTECLDSLAAQTLPAGEVEVIVVINGPRTATPELVAAWRDEHPDLRVTALETDVASVTHARNLGLAAAAAPFVTFVDDDDRVAPGYLAALLAAAGEDRIAIAPGARIHDEVWERPDLSGDMASGPVRWSGRTGSVDDIGHFLRPVWGKVVPTAWARAVRFDDRLAGYGDDTVFWLQVAERFTPDLVVAEVGNDPAHAAYLYRVRADGITGFGAATTWTSHVEPVVAMLAALQECGRTDDAIARLAHRLAAVPRTRILDFAREHPDQVGRIKALLAERGVDDGPARAQDSGPGPGGRWSGVTTEHSGRRFLALFRAGKNSLHPKLTARLEEQNFDYALSWYGDEDPARLGMADGAAFVHRVRGQKWPGLLATLTERREEIAAYDFVWFPDDDLFCEPETISEFFRVMEDLGLDLAQPALTHDSGYVHQIVLQHVRFQARFTNFVELMCPAMSREMLQRALPTMAGTLSGWGVDAVWPRLTRVGKVAIIDATTIRHTRPILGGDGYQTNQSAGVPMGAEEAMAFERYGVSRFAIPHLNLGGLLEDGSTVCLGGPDQTEPELLIKNVIESVFAGPATAMKTATYLGDHAAYIKVENHALLPAALNESLAGTGIRFGEVSR